MLVYHPHARQVADADAPVAVVGDRHHGSTAQQLIQERCRHAGRAGQDRPVVPDVEVEVPTVELDKSPARAGVGERDLDGLVDSPRARCERRFEEVGPVGREQEHHVDVLAEAAHFVQQSGTNGLELANAGPPPAALFGGRPVPGATPYCPGRTAFTNYYKRDPAKFSSPRPHRCRKGSGRRAWRSGGPLVGGLHGVLLRTLGCPVMSRTGTYGRSGKTVAEGSIIAQFALWLRYIIAHRIALQGTLIDTHIPVVVLGPHIGPDLWRNCQLGGSRDLSHAWRTEAGMRPRSGTCTPLPLAQARMSAGEVPGSFAGGAGGLMV